MKPIALSQLRSMGVLTGGLATGFIAFWIGMGCIALEGVLPPGVAVKLAFLPVIALVLAPLFVLRRFQPLLRIGTTVVAAVGAFFGFWSLGLLLAH